MNIKLIYKTLPQTVHGFTVEVEQNKSYWIVLNNISSKTQQRRTYQHELSHIRHNDFNALRNGADLNEIETARHNEDATRRIV